MLSLPLLLFVVAAVFLKKMVFACVDVRQLRSPDVCESLLACFDVIESLIARP